MAWKFKRGLENAFLAELAKLARPGTWFNDVLHDPDLIIGIRDNYLNVYTNGQSLFKAEWKSGKIKVSTHPKYLLDPNLKHLIPLEGSSFKFAKAAPMIESYTGRDTLKLMKRASNIYSGAEKAGVHRICCAKRNIRNIVDLEIALTQSAEQGEVGGYLEPEGNSARKRGAVAKRMDVACFEEIDGKIHLCFWEAKDYGNGELWASDEGSPHVIKQVSEYRALIAKYHSEILKSYREIAKNLVALAVMAERPYGVDDMVAKVAAGQEFVVDPTKVGIVFFGFSKIQKDSERHTTMIDRLKRGKIAVVAAGEAKGIELNWKRGAK